MPWQNPLQGTSPGNVTLDAQSDALDQVKEQAGPPGGQSNFSAEAAEAFRSGNYYYLPGLSPVWQNAFILSQRGWSRWLDNAWAGIAASMDFLAFPANGWNNGIPHAPGVGVETLGFHPIGLIPGQASYTGMTPLSPQFDPATQMYPGALK
jgi:hypothetical protein